MVKPVKRSYDSTQRQAQARLTRARVRDAAAELFVERGYAATSIAAIAERADVSTQTIFATFRGKAALLSEAIEVALAGDDEPVALADRPETQEAGRAPTAAEAAAAFARVGTALLARAGGLLWVGDAAAQQDPELHQMWIAGHRGRHQDMTGTAHSFAAAGFLRPGLTVEAAADLLWVYSDPGTYCSFRLIRGFTDEQFEAWLANAVLTTLFVAGPDGTE